MSAAAASPRTVLQQPPAEVCHQRGAVFSLVGGELGALAAEAVSNGPTALASMGGAIDSSMALVGPVFLDHPEVLGVNRLNLDLLGQTGVLDQLDGDMPLGGPPVVFTQRQAVGDPVVAATVRYTLRLRQAAVGVAATYGLTPRLDVSLLMPLVATSVSVRATRQVTDVLNPASGRFLPVSHQPVVAATAAGSTVRQGDLVLRLKYALGECGPVTLAGILAVQFPTGVPEALTGTGGYWLAPSLVASYPLWHGRAQLSAQLGGWWGITQPELSKLSYGIGGSVALIPKRLALVAEVLGQSHVTDALTPEETGVLTLLSNRTLVEQPALGALFGRTDQVDLAIGLRWPLWQTERTVPGIATPLPVGLLAFAMAVVPLTQQGLRPSGAFVAIGVGGTY